jgi:DNA-binding response OmpR family regulator
MLQMLVVDADRDIREMVADLLADQGIVVLEAEAADDAMRVMQDQHLDLLLCHLPILRADGQITRCARALLPPARVVAMSAIGGIAAGHEADASLAKPFTRAQLLAALGSGPVR